VSYIFGKFTLHNSLGIKMQIRSLRTEDLDALLRLYTHLHATDDPSPGSNQLAEVWAEVLENQRCRYFGGFVSGELVSCCTIMVIPNLTRGARPYGLIENVVTHQEHRGHGYGKALLAQALEFGWSQHCYKVMLMTGRKDDATHHFYESAGFDSQSKKAFVAKFVA
jgi:GNAT superfamily N-acetyltransferase